MQKVDFYDWVKTDVSHPLRRIIGKIFYDFPAATVHYDRVELFHQMYPIHYWRIIITVNDKNLVTNITNPQYTDVTVLIQDIHRHMWLNGWNPGNPTHFLDGDITEGDN
jgi:hypothetical protein